MCFPSRGALVPSLSVIIGTNFLSFRFNPSISFISASESSKSKTSKFASELALGIYLKEKRTELIFKDRFATYSKTALNVPT